jgi:hypothetical protein
VWMAIPKVPYYYKDIMLSNSSLNSLICSIVYIHSVMLRKTFLDILNTDLTSTDTSTEISCFESLWNWTWKLWVLIYRCQPETIFVGVKVAVSTVTITFYEWWLNSLICSIVYIHSVMLTFSLTANLERNTQICLGFFVRICR